MDDPSRKRPGTPGDILTDWLNQMLQEISNDPVMRELWSAMNVGGKGVHRVAVDPYQVLGLEKTATGDQVKGRYRELAVMLHPDTAKGKGTGYLFQLVTAAYQQINREKGW